VTACDMANVPLEDKSVDVCVFCLSLMGTNLADFIREAHRVLKDNGRVQIAEVRSRIEYSHSQKGGKKKDDIPTQKSEGTLEEFVDVLNELGFESVRTDRSNKMFLTLELKKSGNRPNHKLTFSAKPCIYKRR
jgi:ribosomal RNA-processing protein 8